MIDTVKIFSASTLIGLDPTVPYGRYSKPVALPSNWNRGFFNHPNSYGTKHSSTYDDPDSGYHGYGHNGEVMYHRVSLPRLLHGQNGKLIRNQAEIDTAMELFKEKAGEICEGCFDNMYFTRVDLVWQFQGDAADYIIAHRTARHPNIRRGPSFYESRSMAFKGSELRITIYDKVLERFKTNGDIVRVEIQVKGRRLMKELGNNAPVTHLDFGNCYQAFRRIMLGFVPSSIPKINTQAEFLAIGEREGWKSDGVPAFDIYARNIGKRQVSRLKKEMAACRPTIHQLDWNQLLPAEGPPKAIDLEYPTQFKTKK